MALRKSKKRLLLASRIIAVLLMILSFVFVSVIKICDILPLKHFVLLVSILLFIIFVNSWFLFSKQFRNWLKILTCFISTIIIIILSLGLFYLQKTYDFIDKIGQRGYETERYYVLINKEFNYEINDLVNKSVGTYNEHTDLYDELIKKYKETIDSNLIEYESLGIMANNLLNQELDAIVISEAHKIQLEDDLENFKDSIKQIYEIDIKVKKDTVNHPNIDIKTEVFTIFLAGSDSRGDISKRSNCDVNMLITVNPNTYEILLVSIPRDYYVRLRDKDNKIMEGYKDKLTHAGYYGINSSIYTIEDFMNIDIDYYIKVGFNTVTELVDMIGGVDVYSDKTFVSHNYKDVIIKEGINHMDGRMALGFARERMVYSTGDRHRIQNQQDVLAAILKKLTNGSELLLKYTSILDTLKDCLEMSFTSKDITNLINLQLDKMPSWTIKTYNLDGYDSSGYTYSYGDNTKLWVMEPNYDTVNKASSYINGMKKRLSFNEIGL